MSRKSNKVRYRKAAREAAFYKERAKSAYDRLDLAQMRHAAELEELRRECDRRVDQSRRGRNVIYCDLDAIFADNERQIQIRGAYADMAHAPYDKLYSAYMFDREDMLRRSDRERQEIVRLIGKEFAEFTLASMLQKWRTR